MEVAAFYSRFFLLELIPSLLICGFFSYWHKKTNSKAFGFLNLASRFALLLLLIIVSVSALYELPWIKDAPSSLSQSLGIGVGLAVGQILRTIVDVAVEKIEQTLAT